MRSTFYSVFLGLFLSFALMPVAQAHTIGAHGAGFVQGLVHPLLGIDHLLAMVAVGIWAAQLGGTAIWLAPLAFVGLMTVSAFFGYLGVNIPTLEPAIAGTVLVLGLLVAFGVRMSIPLSVGLVALFAIFHGVAHGQEFPQTASPALYCMGLALTTALLQGAGLAFGLSMRRFSLFTRIGGALIALTGMFLLATA